MKKWILLFVLLVIVPPCWAAPWLACDWQTGVTSSEVEVNGVVRPGTVVQSGSDMILLDLAGYANGAYTFRARFVGEGGWPSDWSSPFDAVKPAGTGNVLRIKK
jgi:hypothetical protein